MIGSNPDYLSIFISTIVPILISLGAVGVSIRVFLVKQKNEEFRIALEIHDKLEQKVNELIQVYPDSQRRRDKSLEYLNIVEYFAFLVNSKEIKNRNIQKYFKSSLKEDVREIFKEYPDLSKKEDTFEETKKLLEKWKINSLP